MTGTPRHERRAESSGSRDRDLGVTFIEILVSVVLLGIAGIAVLAGMATTLRGTATHDRLATVQANLSDAGDYLTDITFGADNYVSCATLTDYDVSAWQVDVTSVEFWDGSTWVDSSLCAGGEMQKVSLRSTAGGLERNLAVIKRQATTAISAGGAWNDNMVAPQPHPNLP